MHHPLLGTLIPMERIPGGFRCTISYGGRDLPLDISPDEVSIEQAVSFAAEIASAIPSYDQLSKTIAARDLLVAYNSGWNKYEQLQEDGTYKSIVNPEITEEEFIGKLKLKSISICADTCVDLWYEDPGLFWGHSIYVSSLDGGDFKNAKAQLFG